MKSKKSLTDESSILILEKYIDWFSDYFKNNPPDNKFILEMFAQIIELGKAIKLLLKNGFESQCFTLNRTLGEISILIFVSCSLKEKSKNAYLAIYELHGWFELLDVFKKLNFKKHEQETKYLTKVKKRMAKLTDIIFDEFSEPGDKKNEKEIKAFVHKKMSDSMYTDAKILSRERYKDMPAIQKSIDRLLKKRGQYKLESSFTHGKYLSTFLKNKEIKTAIIKDTTNRMHLSLIIYALDKNVPVPDIETFFRD